MGAVVLRCRNSGFFRLATTATRLGNRYDFEMGVWHLYIQLVILVSTH
jgi:hypothetical protein